MSHSRGRIADGRRRRRQGGVGFSRVDSYAASGAPVLTGLIQPAPFVARLPFLTALAPARVGQVYPVRCASAPGDLVTLYASLATAQIPVPPNMLPILIGP